MVIEHLLCLRLIGDLPPMACARRNYSPGGELLHEVGSLSRQARFFYKADPKEGIDGGERTLSTESRDIEAGKLIWEASIGCGREGREN